MNTQIKNVSICLISERKEPKLSENLHVSERSRINPWSDEESEGYFETRIKPAMDINRAHLNFAPKPNTKEFSESQEINRPFDLIINLEDTSETDLNDPFSQTQKFRSPLVNSENGTCEINEFNSESQLTRAKEVDRNSHDEFEEKRRMMNESLIKHEVLPTRDTEKHSEQSRGEEVLPSRESALSLIYDMNMVSVPGIRKL